MKTCLGLIFASVKNIPVLHLHLINVPVFFISQNYINRSGGKARTMDVYIFYAFCYRQCFLSPILEKRQNPGYRKRRIQWYFSNSFSLMCIGANSLQYDIYLTSACIKYQSKRGRNTKQIPFTIVKYISTFSMPYGCDLTFE